MAGVFGALREPLGTLTAREPLLSPGGEPGSGGRGHRAARAGVVPRLLPPSPPSPCPADGREGQADSKRGDTEGPKGTQESACHVEPDGGGRLCGPPATATCTRWGSASSGGVWALPSEAVRVRTGPAPERRRARLGARVLGFGICRVPWGVAYQSCSPAPVSGGHWRSLVVVPGLAGLPGQGAAGLHSGLEATVLSPNLQVV